MSSMSEDEKHATAQEFNKVVNMTQASLSKWLDTEESRSVGMRADGEKVADAEQGEAVGHRMGRTILDLRAKKAADLDDADYAAMRKVVGYVHRHSKQRPDGDVTDTRWRKSLMNWGHDPLK